MFKFVAGRFAVKQATLENLESAENALLQHDIPSHVRVEKIWTDVEYSNRNWGIHSLFAWSGQEPGVKPTLVILHGHSAGSASFAAAIGVLSEQFDVYSIDLPGWGRSSAPETLLDMDAQTVYETYAGTLEAWRKARNLEQFYLMGHSYGGFLATKYAKMNPTKLFGLILVAPGGMFPMAGPNSWLAGVYFKYMSVQRVATCLGPLSHPLFHFFLKKVAKNNNRLMAEYYFQLASKAGLGFKSFNKFIEFRRCYTQSQWVVPISQIAAEVSVPMVMVWGEKDNVIGMDYAKLVHRVLRTPLYIVANATHNPTHGGMHNTFACVITDAVSAMGVHQLKLEPVVSLTDERSTPRTPVKRTCADCNEGEWWCSCVMSEFNATPSRMLTNKTMASLVSHIESLIPARETPPTLLVRDGQFIESNHDNI